MVALSLGKALAGVQMAGINIAGFGFGCVTDMFGQGTCEVSRVWGPFPSLSGSDGPGQMQHFTSQYGFKTYRLPVAWQYLVNNQLGGPLYDHAFGKYDELMQACLATGACCIIDIHNFARWNGGIIGQGGPSDDQFASLWSQLAAKYVHVDNVIFGLVNEPHDMPDINRWAQSVQAAVTAIRKTGANTQMILLPGTDYASAQTFMSSSSGAAFAAVTNLDGSTTNLIFDVHKYLDVDNFGTHILCASNHINDSFAPLAAWLRVQNRQALLTETGGSPDASCVTLLCNELAWIDRNADVYLGFLGWAAGSFTNGNDLSLTPAGSAAAGWVDKSLISQCFGPVFQAGSLPVSVSSTSTTMVVAGVPPTTITGTTSRTSSFSNINTTTISSSSVVFPQTTLSTVTISSSAAAVLNPASSTSTVSSTSWSYTVSAAINATLFPVYSPTPTISTSSLAPTAATKQGAGAGGGDDTCAR